MGRFDEVVRKPEQGFVLWEKVSDIATDLWAVSPCIALHERDPNSFN